MSVGVALVVGLLQGFLHCTGMCGPFILAFGLSRGTEPATARSRLAAALPEIAMHNLGRIAGFTALGAVFGAVGSFVNTAARLTGLQAAAGLIGGALMIAWAVDQWRSGHGGAVVERWSLLRLGPFRRALRGSVGRRGPAAAFVAGLILALHPCGLLFSMLLAAAATGSAAGGSMTLAAFGLGTVPAMVGVAMAGAAGGQRLRGPAFSRVAAVLIGCTGLLFALRGLAVNGLVPDVSPWLF